MCGITNFENLQALKLQLEHYNETFGQILII